MKILIFLAALIFSGAASAQSIEDAKAAYDRSLDWIKSERMVNGYIVSDREAPSHLISVGYSEASQEYVAKGAAFAASEPILGLKAFLSPDKKTLLVEDGGKLTPVALNETLPGLPEFYFSGATDSEIKVKLAFLYDNTDVVYSLLQMHEATKEKRYLDDAGDILKRTIPLIDENGQYVRRFANEKATYTGMAQGIIMRLLDDYYAASGEEWSKDALMRMVAGFKHTTEGTWNHWTNSAIGIVVAERYGSRNVFLQTSWGIAFGNLMKQIDSQKGVIPYIMDPKDKRWPMHKPTYQTYDLFLLLNLAQVAPETKPQICEFFNLAFQDAAAVNYGEYGARNAQSAYLGKKLCGVDKSQFLNSMAADAIAEQSAPADINDAKLRLFSLAAYIASAKD